GQWRDRKGVMQFHHPHHFRQQVADALLAEMPEVWRALLAAGAVPAVLPGQPGVPAGLHCRRVTFERVLRSAARAEPGVRLRTGHVDEVSCERGRATGVKVGGRQVDADLVIDSGGRAGRLTRALRGPARGGDCGIAYVSRQYQMLPGATAGPVNTPFGVMETYPGYLVAVFIHDNQILSALIARASTDRPLAALRTRAAFDAATRAVPALAAWTDPGRSRPLTPVLPGDRLYNSYQGQLNGAGRVALDGLIYAGDSVCTTNPAAGRGVTTSLQQARQLIGLLGEHGRDFTSCSVAFDHWCAGHIKPWFDDHVYWDADLIRRWSGQDVDLTRPLPPDLIMAAAQADPEMIKVVGPYQAMLALPDSLDAVQARARAIYASGWRPPIPPGPTREELAELVTAAASCQGHRTEDAALFAAIAGQCPGRSARAKRGNRASTVWGGRPSHVAEAPWLPRRPSRRPATSHVSSRT
ncbi:MAG TPA: tryptophan 7-halogenase, partial [Streptosporangiaceae bacterium]|nr:tryptophan 7-halogenase [Streptosporangiaceae bacterium]